MNATEFIEKVQSYGVTLEASGDRLLLYPAGRVPPELKELIPGLKPRIMAILTAECHCLWSDSVLPPPHYCPRYGETGICRTCGGCRTCWLIRMKIVVQGRPRG
jgi:hypothetical protein